jgi:hypothetical protein
VRAANVWSADSRRVDGPGAGVGKRPAVPCRRIGLRVGRVEHLVHALPIGKEPPDGFDILDHVITNLFGTVGLHVRPEPITDFELTIRMLIHGFARGYIHRARGVPQRT